MIPYLVSGKLTSGTSCLFLKGTVTILVSSFHAIYYGDIGVFGIVKVNNSVEYSVHFLERFVYNERLAFE